MERIRITKSDWYRIPQEYRSTPASEYHPAVLVYKPAVGTTLQPVEIVDDRPGHYYVTAIDGRRVARLLGPYTRHEDALDRVEYARMTAETIDPRAAFWAFGTARYERDRGPGAINKKIKKDACMTIDAHDMVVTQ